MITTKYSFLAQNNLRLPTTAIQMAAQDHQTSQDLDQTNQYSPRSRFHHSLKKEKVIRERVSTLSTPKIYSYSQYIPPASTITADALIWTLTPPRSCTRGTSTPWIVSLRAKLLSAFPGAPCSTACLIPAVSNTNDGLTLRSSKVETDGECNNRGRE